VRYGKNARQFNTCLRGWLNFVSQQKRLCVFRVQLRLHTFYEHFGKGYINMPDYEKLYHPMVGAAEDALAALETGNIWDARRILTAAEQEAEDRYVEDR